MSPRQIEGNHLPSRVHSRIGAAGGQDRIPLPAELPQRPFYDPLYRRSARSRLTLKAGEIRAIVFQRRPVAAYSSTSSSNTISAASPSRRPRRNTRV